MSLPASTTTSLAWHRRALLLCLDHQIMEENHWPKPETWSESVLALKIAAHIKHKATVATCQENHKTWRASPSKTCIHRIGTMRTSLLIFSAQGDPYLQVLAGSVHHMTHGDWNERADHIHIALRFREEQGPVKLTCVMMLRPTT